MESHTTLVGGYCDELTVCCWGELDNGVQRDLDVRKLFFGDVHEIANDAPHDSLGG